MMAAGSPQLLLPFPHVPSRDNRDFVRAASNHAALAWLDAASDPGWPDLRLALWGPEGCGKSHLLRIWAERAGARTLTADTVGRLDGLPERGALALDNADALGPEPVLLHLLNIARDRGLRILLAGRTPPSRWPVRLPDLSSRLRAINAVEIGAPGDDLLAPLLMRLLSDRQLSVAPGVRSWLLTRLPRTPQALRDAVAQLDKASLAAGKPITRPLASQVLFGLPGDDEV